MNSKISRRNFLGTSAAAAATFSVIPNIALGSALGHNAPSDKLNIAVVGPGGRGRVMLNAAKPHENIVALCDCDWKQANHVFDENPNAKRYKDYRKMFDEMGKSIDAIIVATADHTHACITATAITLGKHVYVEKPLAHTVYESRLLTKLAQQYKVATTMGNQGSSGPGVRLVCDWILNGEIGDVTRVDSFTDRPIWPQGLNTPKQAQWVPDHLDWDIFTGPARLIPYHEIYHPWNWRGWWEYGTGALGDMACHVMHPIFKALNLGYPTKVQGTSSMLLADSAPVSQSVKYIFPARPTPRNSKVRFPEVEVNWYDGGHKPRMPEGWPEGKRMNVGGGGCIFYGSRDILICGSNGRDAWLLSGRTPNAPKTQREVLVPSIPQTDSNSIHTMDWVRACKENPENRTPTASDFIEAGPFNEMVVMGVLAVRLQGLEKILLWDGENMQFTNIRDNETISMIQEDRFSVVDGNPNINPIMTEPVNAKAFAQELIKHTYREGWSLPAMPS